MFPSCQHIPSDKSSSSGASIWGGHGPFLELSAYNNLTINMKWRLVIIPVDFVWLLKISLLKPRHCLNALLPMIVISAPLSTIPNRGTTFTHWHLLPSLVTCITPTVKSFSSESYSRYRKGLSIAPFCVLWLRSDDLCHATLYNLHTRHDNWPVLTCLGPLDSFPCLMTNLLTVPTLNLSGSRASITTSRIIHSVFGVTTSILFETFLSSICTLFSLLILQPFDQITDVFLHSWQQYITVGTQMHQTLLGT